MRKGGREGNEEQVMGREEAWRMTVREETKTGKKGDGTEGREEKIKK